MKDLLLHISTVIFILVLLIVVSKISFNAGRKYERNKIESALKSQGAVWIGNLTNHGVIETK